ncbi:MAG: GDSL-type esterase/lipase family protein, partial [Anaerolineaceae bacterium]|nr:GDSL-type esterase/lipase family protein [Anaerolineaceae bacterium]
MRLIPLIFLILFIGILIWIGAGLFRFSRYQTFTPKAFLKKRGKASGRKVLVCMGDSITRGNVSANYVHILSQRLFERDFILVNAGINAELTYNLLQRLDEIIACEPDYITILIGTNDADGTLSEATASRQMRQMKLPQKSTSAWFESNLQKIITELQTHTEAKIALLSIPPIGELNTLQAF